jgi:alpha-L-fucosidase
MPDLLSFLASIDRRNLIMAAAAAPVLLTPDHASSQPPPGRDPSAGSPTADQQRRMAWWHQAKFGMFIHFGLYAAYGRHEWAMENEAIPVADYQKLVDGFRPAPGSARKWAALAKAAGMKYMVLTSKHHEGFCNWDTKLTNYNAVQFGPKRDIVGEYVQAAREQGLRVGFYYSLMDWHHPDGARCANDEEARKRFVEYTHGLIRELLTNYGKVDVLWYDVSWPLNSHQWESERMNKMVFELQPDILVNNRNGLPGDFSTPEQTITAAAKGRSWESCMTLNGSWGYQRADDSWKTPKTIVRNLIQCASGGGNYLLNIGPKPDGSIPPESVSVLTEVGKWLAHNGETIYETDRCNVSHSEYAQFTRKDNTLYMHVHYWPGDYVAIGGLKTEVKSAHFVVGGKEIKFQQEQFRTRFTSLPKDVPDSPVTTIAIECASEPIQDTNWVRTDRPRSGVGV